MKYKFEGSDIENGAYVIKQTSPKGSTNLSFARTVTFKIGFKHERGKTVWCKISVLTDGWVCVIGEGTEEEILEHLNTDEHGYRPLTKKEFVNMLNATEQGFISLL